MSQEDQELTIDNAVDEIDLLVMKHGIAGGSYRFLKSHTSLVSWVRFGLFVSAAYALYTGLQAVTWYGPYGVTVNRVGTVEAAVWTLLAMAVMFTTWKGLGHVLD